MQTKNKKANIKKLPKNRLIKKKIKNDKDDIKKKIQNNIPEAENEIGQSDKEFIQMIKILFNKNKFKIRNDFDREHCKEFLKEKEKYFQQINLNDSLSDEGEESGIKNRILTKFTFGHH